MDDFLMPSGDVRKTATDWKLEMLNVKEEKLKVSWILKMQIHIKLFIALMLCGHLADESQGSRTQKSNKTLTDGELVDEGPGSYTHETNSCQHFR